MQRHFFSLRIAAIVIIAAIAVGSLDLWFNGYAVVHDPDARLSRVEIVHGDGSRQAMRQFANGYWGARPKREGAMQLVCLNGVEAQAGNAMPGMRRTRTATLADCTPRT